MKKKRLLFLGFIFIFLFSLSGVFSAETAEGKTINLSFAHIFPASHYQAAEVYAMWAEEIEAATKGKVKSIFIQ